MRGFSGDGFFIVGVDIRPGVYRMPGPIAGRVAAYALLSSLADFAVSGNLVQTIFELIRSRNSGNIMDWALIFGPTTMVVGPGVKAVKTEGCMPWERLGDTLDAAIQAAEPPSTPLITGDGLFVVGIDIQPGVYRTPGPASDGGVHSYKLLSSASVHDTIDDQLVNGPATVTIGPGVKAFETSGFLPWQRIGDTLDAAIQAVEPPSTPLIAGEGLFVVGIDIQPGTYHANRPERKGGGFYFLLSSTNTNDIIDQGRVHGPADIYIGPGVKAVNLSGFRLLQRVDNPSSRPSGNPSAANWQPRPGWGTIRNYLEVPNDEGIGIDIVGKFIFDDGSPAEPLVWRNTAPRPEVQEYSRGVYADGHLTVKAPASLLLGAEEMFQNINSMEAAKRALVFMDHGDLYEFGWAWTPQYRLVKAALGLFD
ncbi:hypothetical protein [Trebonia sp.]|uniref:hypothetical protein n=1 Tax=Trebonia sp. TaxID=2767075 RepID=UPI002624254E|nr:hypothetical protein [Trebonia sp.]